MIDTIRTKFKERKKSFITGIILFFLMLTNPNLREFKDFSGTNKKMEKSLGIYEVTREINGFFFSVYNDSGNYYLGIAKNFIRI